METQNQQDIKITDFISLLNTDTVIEVKVANAWLDAYVVGIDIPSNTLKVNISTNYSTSSYMWVPLYFQLNKNHLKFFKVRFK